MEKQIIQQKNGELIYTDGSREKITDYRDRLKLGRKNNVIIYPREEQAERDRIIAEIFKYDKSAGMHYDPDKGFIRNEEDGRRSYHVTLEAAKETFSGVTTRELQRIERAMERTRGAENE